MPYFYRWKVLLPFALIAVTLAPAQDKTPEKPPSGVLTFPSNEQMRHYKAMDDPQLSPDGQQVLVRITGATADGARSHIWLVAVAGGPARQLTYSPEGDKRGERTARWMPDGGSVLFLAHRGEHTSLYRLPMQGGEAKAYDLKAPVLADASKLPDALPTPSAEKATEKKTGEKVEPVGDALPLDVVNFRIAPDGKTVAVIARDPETPGEKKQQEAKADAVWVDHDLHRSRLYLMSLSPAGDMVGALTLAGIPVDVSGAAWSADSTKLVVDAEEPNGVGELGPAGSEWVVLSSDAAHPVKRTELPATAGSAVWSRDGASLIYLAQARRDTPPGYADLYVDTLKTQSIRDLTEGFMGSVGRQEPIALADGGVVEDAAQGLDVPVMRYSAEGKPEPVKLPVAVVSAVKSNAAQNGWVFTGSSGGQDTELLYAARLGDAPRVLTTPGLMPKGVRSLAPQRIEWKIEGKNDKTTVEGLLYLPPQAAAGKVPLVVDVHGGPLGMFSDSFASFVDFLLGHGWAVLRTNPRGSTGRGAEFAAANHNDLGGGDYRDIMAGVDYVVKTEPVDASRMALMGYSYGGEMAAFVETKTTRFKAIVSMAPVIDQNSEYGTERGSWYDQWYYGKPWLHEADAWRQSPLSGAAQAKTPFMLIQGQGDTTDPLGQSLEMYHALRQMGVPVDLITYPRDDHGPLGGAIFGSPSPEPWHGFDARQRIVAFLNTAFDKPGTAVAATAK